MYDSTVQELPRTKNKESSHRGCQSIIGGCDPNIWKFLDILKKYQAVQQVAMNQNMENLEIVQRRKYRHILHIVENYNNRHVIDHLRDIAYNFHMWIRIKAFNLYLEATLCSNHTILLNPNIIRLFFKVQSKKYLWIQNLHLYKKLDSFVTSIFQDSYILYFLDIY